MLNFTIQKFMATLIAILFTVSSVMAQAPQAIPYQAAARNSSGVIITNKTIALRFTLHDATTTGTIVYQEKQNAVTNTLGMFIVNIGQGSAVTGSFSSINWSVNSKFMQVELDTTGTGNTYTDMGTQQLMSVPYALNAKKADSAINAYNGVPTGTIVAFGGDSTIPTGWALCNGAEQSTTDPVYAKLYAAIGNAWGTSGAGKFNLPYLGGLFLRGKSFGGGNAPDVASRVAIAPGANSGEHVGSWQNCAFQGHIHSLNSNILEGGQNTTPSTTGLAPGGQYWNVGTLGSSSPGNADNSVSTPTSDGIHGTPVTASETRPVNAYVNYIIKL